MSGRDAAPRVPPPERVRHRSRLRTRWSDEDNHGVLNNAVFLTLFEEARLDYFDALGAMDGNRFPFVLAATNVRFLAPGRGGAEVTVEVATTRLGDSSITQAYRVLGPDDTAWCEAEARLVTVDAAGAKRPIPPSLRASVERFEERGVS